jgi:signal transduction histidine kinase
MIQTHLSEPERVQQLAELIAGQAERAGRLTARMLGFARRGAADGGTEGQAPIDVNVALTEVAELLGQGLRADVRLRFKPVVPSPLLVAIGRAELEAAVINLCVNARDAMPGGGDIIITTDRATVSAGGPCPAGLEPGDYARVAVRDTGHGMDAATLARVGEPFFTTKLEGQGTGLGLSMARGFALRAGGMLQIESTLGTGTTVTIWLPDARKAAAPHPQ